MAHLNLIDFFERKIQKKEFSGDCSFINQEMIDEEKLTIHHGIVEKLDEKKYLINSTKYYYMIFVCFMQKNYKFKIQKN